MDEAFALDDCYLPALARGWRTMAKALAHGYSPIDTRTIRLRPGSSANSL